MSESKKTNKATVESKHTAAKATAENTFASAKEMVTGVSSALNQSTTAYVTGLSAIAKTMFGIGQEVAHETIEHGKSSLKANCVKNLAELQAAYVTHRIESSSVHLKDMADVAVENVKKVYSPLIGLLKSRDAA